MVKSEMAESEVEVIHSWSAPRSLSTSLMYSFAQVSLSHSHLFSCQCILLGANKELTYCIILPFFLFKFFIMICPVVVADFI